MPCFHPLEAWRSKDRHPSGKQKIVFNARLGGAERLQLPCGRCVGCRLERSRQWAVRLMHEAQLHQDSMFLTLTYDNEHLPQRYLRGHDKKGNPLYSGALLKRHFQLFMKRLRRKFPDREIKFFHCGEYGEKYRRPHYHAIVFGLDFADKAFFKEKHGHRLHYSLTLEKLWPHGSAIIGSVTFESAAYVARYIMKKINGPAADVLKDGLRHYESVDIETGEIQNLPSEYITMSNRRAIGKAWFEAFSGETYRDDSVVMRGREMKPPKYYDKLYEIGHPVQLQKIKEARKKRALQFRADNTPDRLRVREEVKQAQINQLKRDVE